MYVTCDACGKENIEVSDDLPPEIILLDIWVCDECYFGEDVECFT